MQNQTIQSSTASNPTCKRLGTSLVKTATQKVLNDPVIYSATPVTNCSNGFSGAPSFTPATTQVAVLTAAKLYGQMMQMQALATNTDTQFLQQSAKYTVSSCSSNSKLTKEEVSNIIDIAIAGIVVGSVLKTAQVTFTALSSSSNLKGTAAKTKYDTVKFDLDRHKVPEEVLNEIKNTPLSDEKKKEIRKSLADHLTEKSTGEKKLTELNTQYAKDTAPIKSKMENGIPLTADEEKSYKELKTKYGADKLAIEEEKAAKEEAFDKLVAANPAGYAKVAGLVKDEHDQAVKNLLKEKSAVAAKPYDFKYASEAEWHNPDPKDPKVTAQIAADKDKLLDKPYTVIVQSKTVNNTPEIELTYKVNGVVKTTTIPADAKGTPSNDKDTLEHVQKYLNNEKTPTPEVQEILAIGKARSTKLNEDIKKANEELTKHTTLSDTTNEEYSKKYLTNLQEEEAKFMKTGMLHGIHREISDALNSFTQQGLNAGKEYVNNTKQTEKNNLQASNQTNLQLSGNEEQSAQGQVQAAGNWSQLMSQLLEMIF